MLSSLLGTRDTEVSKTKNSGGYILMGETLKEMYREGLRRSLPDFKPRDGHRNDPGRVSVLDVQ